MWYIFLKKNSLTQFFFYSTLKSFFFLDFTKASYRLYCQKRVAILKKKMKKIIKNKLYAIFFGYLNDTGK